MKATQLAAIIIGGLMIALGLLLPQAGNEFVKVVLYYVGSVAVGYGLVSYFTVPTVGLGLILLVEGIALFVLAFVSLLGFVSTTLFLFSGVHVGAFLVGLFRK